MLNHTFTWNGHSSDEFGIKIERFRALNRSARKYDSASVPGRNGSLYSLQKAWDEVLVSYQIWAKGRPTTNLLDMTQSSAPITGTAEGYVIDGTVSGTSSIQLCDMTETKFLGNYQINGISVTGVSMRYAILTDQGGSYAGGSVPAEGLGIVVPQGYELLVTMTVSSGTYDNVLVPCFMGDRDEIDLAARWTDIMEWLNSADGYAELSDSYDTAHYREAVFVEATDIDNSWNTHGRAVVSFRCRPERFLVSGQDIVIDLNSNTIQIGVVNADFGLNLRPTPYKGISQVMPKGTTFKILGSESLKIARYDTYDGANVRSGAGASNPILCVAPQGTRAKVVGTSGTWTHLNFEADWEYASITTDGWTLTSELSVDSAAATWYKAEMPDGTIGWCDGTYVTTLQAVELNNPTKRIAKPVLEITRSGACSIGINDLVLSIVSSVTTDFRIDCPNENVIGVTSEGDEKDRNNLASMEDVFGNVTAKFLYLQAGHNYITFNGITALNIKANFWEI